MTQHTKNTAFKLKVVQPKKKGTLISFSGSEFAFRKHERQFYKLLTFIKAPQTVMYNFFFDMFYMLLVDASSSKFEAFGNFSKDFSILLPCVLHF